MLAAVFPGQGSQKPGMGKDLFDSFPTARAVFLTVQEATNCDIAKLCFESDEDTLRQTQNAQLALFTCGVAAYSVFSEMYGSGVAAMAGHSVGEYAALAAAGIISVTDGARLVQRRGDLMARSGNLRPGTMAAVLGMDREALEQVCQEASTGGAVAVVANDNCPGQVVISGDSIGIEQASKLAAEHGAKRVLPLNVSGAFHSPLMDDPAKSMGEALRPEYFKAPEAVRVYSNVTADRVDGSTAWPDLLEAQLKSPVRWAESVQNMVRDGATVFIECGAGEVLGGLIRRIDKETRTLAVHNKESLEQTVAALKELEVMG